MLLQISAYGVSAVVLFRYAAVFLYQFVMRDAVEPEQLPQVVELRFSDVVAAFSFEVLFYILLVRPCRRVFLAGDVDKLKFRMIFVFWKMAWIYTRVLLK